MVLENLLGTHLRIAPWWQVGDLRLLVANRYDHTPAAPRHRVHVRVERPRRGAKRIASRLTAYRELVELIEAAGFSVERLPTRGRVTPTRSHSSQREHNDNRAGNEAAAVQFIITVTHRGRRGARNFEMGHLACRSEDHCALPVRTGCAGVG